MRFLLILLMMSFPTFAFASGGGNESPLYFQFINFAVFIAILVFVGRKPVQDALKNRSNQIAQDILEAQRLQQEAADALAKYENMLQEFQQERDQMLQQYRQQGETEKEELIASGKKEAERIKSDAERSIENDRQSMQNRIERELVEEALKRAEVLLVENLKPQDHTRLTNEYFTQVESLSAQ
jgi:F-type H+-transporting ATPase subunit b